MPPEARAGDKGRVQAQPAAPFTVASPDGKNVVDLAFFKAWGSTGDAEAARRRFGVTEGEPGIVWRTSVRGCRPTLA